MLPAVTQRLDRAILGLTWLAVLLALASVAASSHFVATGKFLTAVSGIVGTVLTIPALWRTRAWLLAVRHDRHDDLRTPADRADIAWRVLAVALPVATLLPALSWVFPLLERRAASLGAVLTAALLGLWLASAFTTAVRAYLRSATEVLTGARSAVEFDVSRRLHRWLTARQILAVVLAAVGLPGGFRPVLVTAAYFALLGVSEIATLLAISRVRSFIETLPVSHENAALPEAAGAD